jgi:CRISPR-associated protein Cas5d
MPRDPTHVLEVSGELGCFTRPELKVERWSYPCPTPGAARGIFDAIYFKPQFHWQIVKIEVLSPPCYIALRRNEVGAVVASDRTIASWAQGKTEPMPLFADTPSHRQQRQTMALRNPRFRLHGRIVPRPGFERESAAFDQQFVRRAGAGKCFHQPCLGCREFVAFYRLVECIEEEKPPTAFTQELGWMLYDVFDLATVNDPNAAPSVSVFRARVENGVLDVPPFDSDQVRKVNGGPDHAA